LKTYSLHEVNEYIRRILALNLPEALWVRCEIAQVNEARGHYFIELVQKAEDADEIIAQASAVIWQRSFRQLRGKLGLLIHDLLQDGMEIQLKARIEFNERYGLKFIVEDIDPAYTLGKIEMRRRETIEALRQANLIEQNAQLPLPMVLQRIAIISSERAAGYRDFVKHLQENPYDYQFQSQLFISALQGEQVERDMLKRFREIERRRAQFECVVIIRGGGARLDLAAFDSLPICEAIAKLNLPVLTGIGHDVDETVLDMVAHRSLKTPTAVADFIINRNLLFENAIANYSRSIQAYSQQITQQQRIALQNLQQKLTSSVRRQVQSESRMLDFIQQEIPKLAHYQLKAARQTLQQLEKMTTLLSLETTLKRGFTLTLQDGKLLKSSEDVQPGTITTRFADGETESKVE
jgi:exodeoxyribonuclease VII large subunit